VSPAVSYVHTRVGLTRGANGAAISASRGGGGARGASSRGASSAGSATTSGPASPVYESMQFSDAGTDVLLCNLIWTLEVNPGLGPDLPTVGRPNETATEKMLRPWSHDQRHHDREDASSMVTAGATANTTVKNSRASRESGLLCSHSHWESID